ncbi:MAG: protein-glutamate O-methyltransferase CheR [Thermodesulfobacteriota bacterium]
MFAAFSGVNTPLVMKNQSLSPRNFLKVATFVQDNYGIKMPPSKKTMLTCRLQKRMRQVGIASLDNYIDFVFSPQGRGAELVHMVDALTTNKTDFFREANHFETLTGRIIPLLLGNKEGQEDQSIRIWSAACSSGEEPYTLAMTLREHSDRHRRLPFSILASDISTKVLKKAGRAIYDEGRIGDVPLSLRKKYLLKSKGHSRSLVQFKPLIREAVTFRRINLMDDAFGIREKMDIIFCRNVLIYFSKEDQLSLMHRFAKQLAPGGFLFIGHSESLSGMDVPFTPFLPTIYQKKGGF